MRRTSSWSGETLRRRARARVGPILRIALAFAWLGSGAAMSVSAEITADEASALEAASERAERAAAAARAQADAFREPSEGDPDSPASAAAGRAEAAARRAEAAADEAARLTRAAAERASEGRRRTRRAGPYLGGAFLYAAENFDDSIIVKSSTGGAAYLGYRLGEVFAVELRYEGFEGFDLRGAFGRSEIDGFAITAIGRLHPIAGPVQPFVSVGVGAARFEQKTVFRDGSRQKSSASDGAFRFGAGLDLWLNDFVVLDLEAAYLAPLDDLSELDAVLLSSGLILRF